MKIRLAYLKKILIENMEDFMYLFIAGLPTGILMILISPCMDYTHLY